MPRPIRFVVAAAAIGAGLAAPSAGAHAKVIEERVELPVSVSDRYALRVDHTIRVVIYRDTARRQPQPFLILNHGRSGTAAVRAQLSPGPYGPNARYFVGRGFAVFLPIRVGYGATGGPDVEDSGPCRSKNYPPGFEAAAQQSIAVIDYAKAQPYVDPQRGLVLGQSFGGTTAITLAAKNLPGVLGAVNFAGGGGGNPTGSPENPCREEQLGQLFAGYGRTARIPTLWFYSENDRYFGVTKPRAWFEGFVAEGGHGRFVRLPPYKEDGHPSFTGNPAAWRPHFEEFVRQAFGTPVAPLARKP